MVLNITHNLIQVLLLLIGFKYHEAEAKPIGNNSIGLTYVKLKTLWIA